MKQFHYFLTACALLLTVTVNAQNLIITPEKPIPGDKIKLTYDPTGTPLAGHDAIYVTAYVFEDHRPNAHDIEMKNEDGKFIGYYHTSAKTIGAALSITSTDEQVKDNKNDKGYKFLCYSKDGSKPVQGAYATKSMIYGSYYRYANIERNPEKALNLLKKEFKAYPDSKNNRYYYGDYARHGFSLNNEEIISEFTDKMNGILSDKNADEDQLMAAYGFANNLKNKDLAEEIKSRMLNNFPKGKMAQSNVRSKFRGAQEVDEQIAILEEYKKNYGASENAQPDIDYFLSSIAAKYGKEQDWDNYNKYLNMISDPVRKAGSLNNIAWGLSGEKIGAEAPKAAKGKELSKKSLEFIKSEKESLSQKPDYYSARKWKEILKRNYGMYADTYALCAYQTGDVEEALKYQEITCDLGNFEDAEMNDRYSVYYEKVNGGEATEKLLARLIGNGAASIGMKERHKELFMVNNTVESAYEKYVHQLEKEAIAKKREEIKEKMIEKEAPTFELVNLKGEKVSSESLKGKVVVVDFWATWCGPCKASFPGMQMAVNKYQERDDVAFVFIDTWERGEADAKKKNATEFIEKNNYSFNVLMDNDDKVVASFGVSGIPTKFILDKEGKIRFKSVGFNGNDVDLVRELEMMIDLAGGGANGLTGAP